MDLLQQLRSIALTFESLSHQENFQKLALDSQEQSDISLTDAWQGIKSAIALLESNECN